MTILRQFIIVPSLARLIQKEKGGERVLEGYFPNQPQRRTYVQVEETRSSLILEAGEGAAPDEQTDVPLALLAVCQGQVEYLRTKLSISSHKIQALHFVRPVALDLVVVTSTSEDGQDFPALPWFGPDVSAQPAYQRRRWLWMALRTPQRWMSRTPRSMLALVLAAQSRVAAC